MPKYTELPTYECYTEHTSKNYGLNSLRFFLGDVVVWFSYKTPVAFKTVHGPRIVRQNEWGPTTGKHLNAIDGGDKKSRVDGATFERLWQEVMTDKEQ